MKYTIFIPISREEYAPDALDSIIAMDFPVQDTELLIVLDTNDNVFANRVGAALEIISKTKGIKKIKMQMTGEDPVPEDAHIMLRRQRVMSIWNRMKGMIGPTEYFFGLEDDTVQPEDAFVKLMKHVEDGACFAEGVQVHRQASSIGAWHITKNVAKTLKFKPKGISSINGAGWYCFATKTKYVKQAMIREGGAAMGPDVCFLYDIVNKTGQKGIIDWSVQCGHRTPDGILYANKDTSVLRYKI